MTFVEIVVVNAAMFAIGVGIGVWTVKSGGTWLTMRACRWALVNIKRGERKVWPPGVVTRAWVRHWEEMS